MRYTNRVLSAVILTVLSAAACSRDPQKLKVEYVASGDKYMKDGKVNEAIISYRNAVAQDAMYAEARTKLSAAYKLAGDKGNAMRESVRAADLLPNDPKVQLEAGKWLLEARQFPEARNRATAVLAKEPKNVEGLILLGNSLLGLQDLDGAIKQIEEAIDADPRRTLSYSNLGLIQAIQGNRKEAEATLRRAIEFSPDSVLAHLSLANYLWASSQLKDAEAEMRTALKLDPASVAANKSLAAILTSTGRATEAEPYYKGYAAGTTDVGGKLLLADYYFSMRRQDEGVAALKAVLALPGGFAPATLRLASVEYKAKRFDAAYQMVESVLEKEPVNEDARLVKSRFLINQQRASEALPIAKSVVDGNNQSAGGHLLYAAALEGNGDLDAAIEEYKQVLQLEPSSPTALAKLSDLYFRQGNVNAAAEFVGQVVKNQPNWFTARYLYARSLVALNNLPRAEQEIAGLSKMAPDSAPVEMLRGDLFWARKNYAAARTAYTAANTLDPNAFDAFTAMVKVDLVQGKAAAARSRMEARLAAKPDDKSTQMLAGDTFLLLGDSQSAVQAYKRVLELDDSSMDAYARLGSIYMSEKRLDEARQEFERAAAHEPQRFVAAKTMVGVLLSMQGRHGEARQQYEKVIAIDSQAAVAANNLAYYYSSSPNDSLDMALQLAQVAKSKLPTNGQVNDTIGWIYYKKGLANMALPPLSDGVKALPNDPVLLYHLGMAQIQTKRLAEARDSLNKALKLKSDFEGADDAREALASISR